MAGSLGFISAQGVIPSLTDLLTVAKGLCPAAQAVASAGTTDTISASQIASGQIIRSGAASAVTATTDTATNIIAALANAYVGMPFNLTYTNLNTSTGVVTVVAGVGVTTSGTLTIPIAGQRVFQGTVTNLTTPAVFLASLYSQGAGMAA